MERPVHDQPVPVLSLAKNASAARQSRGRKQRRGSRRAGIAVGAAIVVVAAVGLLLLQQVSTPTQLDGSGLPTIQQALSHVPAVDVPGRDVSTVPRPAGSRRGYFIETKAVVSIVYSQHQDLLNVKHALQPALADDGWKELNIAPGTSPSTGPESTRTWSTVYFHGDRILQVSLFHNGDVTATTYVLQTSTP